MQGQNKLLKIKDIMEIYGISRKTVYNWINRGLPVMRNGNIVRFETEKVEQWFRNN